MPSMLSSQLQALILLSKHHGEMSLQDLSKELHCSINTVIRRIEEINRDLLLKQNLELIRTKERGQVARGNYQEIVEKIALLKERSEYCSWKNRDERRLLVLLHLLSSASGSSKLSILASSVNVAETTVLKDIKQLNLLFYPLVIQSKPGVGTKFVGDKIHIQMKVMEFCYGIMSPMNLVALAHGQNAVLQDEVSPCVSHLLLDFLDSHKIDVKDIISRIQSWEEAMDKTLSDVAYANLLLYLIIFALQIPSSKILLEEKTISSKCSFSNEDTKTYTDNNLLRIHDSLMNNLCIDILLINKHAEKQYNTLEAKLISTFILGLEGNIFYSEQWFVESFSESLNVSAKCSEEIINAISSVSHVLSSDEILLIKRDIALIKYRSEINLEYWDEDMHMSNEAWINKNENIMNILVSICQKKEYNWIEATQLQLCLSLCIGDKKIETIEVLLLCVAGTSTAIIMKKMIEKYCPQLRVKKVLSLRNCTKEELEEEIILSTTGSNILPLHAIVIDELLSEQEWKQVQEKVIYTYTNRKIAQ